MSRSIGQTECARCNRAVATTGPDRPITRDEAHGYFEEFEGLLVADAKCENCGALYLAWVDSTTRLRPAVVFGLDLSQEKGDNPFFDLSYRSSFNDEPGEGDLPPYQESVGFRIWACYRGTGWATMTDRVFACMDEAEDSTPWCYELPDGGGRILPANRMMEPSGGEVDDPHPPPITRMVWDELVDVRAELKEVKSATKALRKQRDGYRRAALRLRDATRALAQDTFGMASIGATNEELSFTLDAEQSKNRVLRARVKELEKG